MSSSSPNRRFDPTRLQGERDLETFAAMDPPDEGWWWVPLAVVATAVPVAEGTGTMRIMEVIRATTADDAEGQAVPLSTDGT